MNLKDLEHIFKPQIDLIAISPEKFKLYFMIVDGEYKSVERCDIEELESWLPMLDCFTYVGSDNNMPRFVK